MIHEITIKIDTQKTKGELLDLFCEGAGYRDDVENPLTKAEFAKRILTTYFLSVIREGRQKVKRELADQETAEELSDLKIG